jgi:hypothetical protein
MGLTILDLSVLLGYFVIVAVIGIISSRLVKTREDYLMGGRRFGKTMMTYRQNILPSRFSRDSLRFGRCSQLIMRNR